LFSLIKFDTSFVIPKLLQKKISNNISIRFLQALRRDKKKNILHSIFTTSKSHRKNFVELNENEKSEEIKIQILFTK
jgi:hypothetical protein